MAITPDQHFAQIEREQARQARLEGDKPSAAEAELLKPNAGPATPEAVRELLREVIDPELGIDIVELGLLRDIKIEGGVIDVNFTVTTPACPLSEFFIGEIRSCLDWLPAIDRVETHLVFEPPWEPEQMSEKARATLGWNS